MTTQERLLSDKAAIAAVLEADLRCYLARDKAGWERCWVQDARFKSVMECGTMQVAQSYEVFRQNVFDAMDGEPDAVEAEVERKGLEIEVSGSIGWATFEELVTRTSNAQAAPSHSHNFRLLEKADGQWRIVFHGCWSEPLRDTEAPAFEVGPERQVVWMNDAARDCLTSFEGLSVSNGVLRATKPGWDKGLQEAIAGGHELTGFGKFNQVASEGDGDVTFPVVLGEGEDGALLLCWVKVADGRVYVLLGQAKDLSKQIGIAKVVYGLSKGQTELIHHLASGSDLTAASEALGITKNTARTHLRRAYEKVGVSSQVELLRLLVSFSV